MKASGKPTRHVLAGGSDPRGPGAQAPCGFESRLRGTFWELNCLNAGAFELTRKPRLCLREYSASGYWNSEAGGGTATTLRRAGCCSSRLNPALRAPCTDWATGI